MRHDIKKCGQCMDICLLVGPHPTLPGSALARTSPVELVQQCQHSWQASQPHIHPAEPSLSFQESAWLTSKWRGPSQISRYATTACMGSRGAGGRDQLGHACTMNVAIASSQAKAENAGGIAQHLVERRGAADSPNACCLATLPTRRVMASGCCLGAMSMILSRLVLAASMHHSCACACACG